MKVYGGAIVILLCLDLVLAQDKPKKIGEPNFSLEGSVAGKNTRNFQGGFNAGVGTKVWEKRDKSFEVGTSYGRGFARMDGHTFKSKPVYGVSGTFRWGKK